MTLSSLDLKLGFKCNNNCLSCPQAQNRHLGDLSTDEVKFFLGEGRKRGSDQVVLTGGEPTVREDILEIIEFAKSIGYKDVQLQSNGRMFCYKEFCEKIIEAGAGSFMLGIHGPEAKVHDFLTRSPGAFEQAIQGVKNLKELGQPVSINSVVNKINYKRLPETAELFAGLKVKQLQFAFIHCVGNALEKIDLLLPKKSEVMPFMHKALDIGIKAGLLMRVEAYPFCFLKGYEKYSSELYMPYKEVRNKARFWEDFRKIQWSAKRKGPQCSECKYDLVCPGPWVEYTNKFGFKELKPVQGKKAGNAKEIIGRADERGGEQELHP